MSGGTGHPLPKSDEARRDEVPESLERSKGEGEDGKEAVQPEGEASDPDGRTYPA